MSRAREMSQSINSELLPALRDTQPLHSHGNFGEDGKSEGKWAVGCSAMSRIGGASVIYKVTMSFCHPENFFLYTIKCKECFQHLFYTFFALKKSFAPQDFIPLVQGYQSLFCLGLFFMWYKRTWEFFTLGWEFDLFNTGFKRMADLCTGRALKFRCRAMAPYTHTHLHTSAHLHPVTSLPFEKGKNLMLLILPQALICLFIFQSAQWLQCRDGCSYSLAEIQLSRMNL